MSYELDGSAGTVTAVTGTAPIASTGGATPAISLNLGGVTYPYIQDVSTTDRLLGRSTAGAGDVEEIVCTPFARTILDDTTAGGVRATIGAGTGDGTVTGVTGTAPIASSGGAAPAISLNDNGVTYAKIQDVTAASRLLGRGSASGAGDPQELTLGTGLSMAGTVLSASGGTDWMDQIATVLDATAVPTIGGELVADKDIFFVDTGAQAYTFNLPSAVKDARCIIRRYGSALGSVTIAPAAGDTSEITTLAVGTAAFLWAIDSTSWLRIAGL